MSLVFLLDVLQHNPKENSHNTNASCKSHVSNSERESAMEQRVTFQETLHTVHFIWGDKTSFEIFGIKAKKTRKQIYQEVYGKKARKHYSKQYSSLTKKEIAQIVKTHVERLKTATVVMHVAPLLDGDLARANLKARSLTKSVPARNRPRSNLSVIRHKV
jgi:hypothetical protein